MDPGAGETPCNLHNGVNETPCQYKGWRRVVRNFTPSWFSVNMGTGVVSILLYNMPFGASWLYWLSVVVFCLNIILFLIFLFASILRYTMYPGIWLRLIRHPAQSMFLGTFPPGLATIVNMVVFVCVPAWGYWASILAWSLWWVDAVVALSTCLFLPFAIMYVHDNVQLAGMTATWLLPIVATIVAAATGAIVAETLENPQHALWTLIFSYILWGTGIPLAMTVLVVYFQRLTIYKLPPSEVIVSVFLPLGPLGQGGFGIMRLGTVARKILPITHTLESGSGPNEMVGEVLYNVGWLMALIMWGYGLVWLFFAIASISRSSFPFNMGWWGFIFPLGVFTLCTVSFGNEMPSTFFKVLGTILSVIVIVLWLSVSILTLRKAWTGEIFFAPCLGEPKPTQSLPSPATVEDGDLSHEE